MNIDTSYHRYLEARTRVDLLCEQGNYEAALVEMQTVKRYASLIDRKVEKVLGALEAVELEMEWIA